MAHNNHFSLSDSEQLSDPSVLTEHLYSGAASVRSSGDPSGLARLLEAAAQAVQRQAAEARVQRGLAIASQTIASELALKCEQLQQRIDGSAGEGAYTTDPRSIPSLTTNSALPPSRSSPKTGPQSVGSPHAGPQTCSPSTAPPPPSTLPARCGPPSTPATYPAPQQPQHAQTQAAVSPVGNALPSYAAQASCSVPARSSINEGAVDRLEPRSFKTWVQDTPQTGAQGNACIGSAPRQLQESPKAPDAEIERQVLPHSPPHLAEARGNTSSTNTNETLHKPRHTHPPLTTAHHSRELTPHAHSPHPPTHNRSPRR